MAKGVKTGGRKAGTPNKATASIKDIAREYTDAAIRTLVSVMAGGEGVPAAAQVSAAKELLDRGYGKATQPVSGDPDGAPIQVVTKVERTIIDPADSNAT